MSFSFQGMILILSFLIGSIPFGVLVARVFHVVDLQDRGSGNIGATNVTRVLGFWPAGFVTFLLDALKGALPILLLSYTGLPSVLGEASGALSASEATNLVTPLLIWTAGFFAVLGHCFSPWVHFNGGKGVATGFGVILVLSPISALAGLIGFAFAFFRTRTGSLASLVGMSIASFSYVIMNPVQAHVWAGAALVFLILIRHEENLDALLEGREKKFT